MREPKNSGPRSTGTALDSEVHSFAMAIQYFIYIISVKRKTLAKISSAPTTRTTINLVWMCRGNSRLCYGRICFAIGHIFFVILQILCFSEGCWKSHVLQFGETLMNGFKMTCRDRVTTPNVFTKHILLYQFICESFYVFCMIPRTFFDEYSYRREDLGTATRFSC